jgi:hypothetical protein
MEFGGWLKSIRKELNLDVRSPTNMNHNAWMINLFDLSRRYKQTKTVYV